MLNEVLLLQGNSYGRRLRVLLLLLLLLLLHHRVLLLKRHARTMQALHCIGRSVRKPRN
jgi:hypothetical protein